MRAPIYSNNPPLHDNDCKLQNRFIALLSDSIVDQINKSLTFVEHGIFLFIQYKEDAYIVNSFPEEVFWNMINGLYKLIHDCSNEILDMFLQVVIKDGLQEIKPFQLTEEAKVQKFENAKEFIKDIENMRIAHYHNMKPVSEADKARVRKVEKKFQEILKNETGPKSDADWERCITWIYKNCKYIQELLDERINFLQTEATDVQKDLLCGSYYRCIRKYFRRIMYEIIKDVLKKKREDYSNKALIGALVNANQKEILDKMEKLIKNSNCRADPYHAALQAVDIILTNKKQIK